MAPPPPPQATLLFPSADLAVIRYGSIELRATDGTEDFDRVAGLLLAAVAEDIVRRSGVAASVKVACR